MKPKISVIMPVYNVEKYIFLAVQSILDQTFENFELIILDDASTDKTYDIINQFSDKRIIKLQNKTNKGIANTLNEGLKIARGEFVSRMDGDDISKTDRFEKQLNFMKCNPELIISGTCMELINSDGKFIKSQEKKSCNEEIGIKLFFGYTSLAHPSIIIRKQLLDLFCLRYDSAFQYAEDYDLYCRSTQYAPMGNLKESLIQYRLHDESVSQKFHMQQQIDAKAALYLHLRRLKLPFTLKQFKIHTNIAFNNESLFIPQKEIQSWFRNLQKWNQEKDYFNKELFERYCSVYQTDLIQRRGI